MSRSFIIFLFLCFTGLWIFPNSRNFHTDLHLGISLIPPLIQDTTAAYDSQDEFLSLGFPRFGFTGSIRYEIIQLLSLGLEGGLYMDWGIFSSPSYYEVPLRGVLRYGSEEIFLQCFGGYLIPLGSSLSGWEVGGKIAYNRIYLSISYIMGEENYLRAEVGMAASL